MITTQQIRMSAKVAMPIIASLCNVAVNEQKIALVVYLFIDIAKRYLMMRNLSRMIFTTDNELHDIAVDAVAGLFRRDANGKFTLLQRYFSNEQNRNIIGIVRIVRRKVDQELVRIFHERNQHVAGIYRNINVAVSMNPRLAFMKIHGKKIIFRHNVKPLHKGHIPIELLEREYRCRFRVTDHFGACIEKMLDIVDEYDEYANYVALDTAASLIRRNNYKAIFDDRATYRYSSIEDTSDIDKALETVFTDISGRIDVALNENRIDRTKAELFRLAIADYIGDLKHGSPCSQRLYLERYVPGLTTDKYRKEYRIQFEYLVWAAVRELKRHLADII